MAKQNLSEPKSKTEPTKSNDKTPNESSQGSSQRLVIEEGRYGQKYVIGGLLNWKSRKGKALQKGEPISGAKIEAFAAALNGDWSKYTLIGERARAEGMCPVFVGSEPYRAWLTVRGANGMPGFVDQAFINGKLRQIVWMDSV